MTLTIDLVAHMDAGDRTKWQGNQNERPLTELGRQQALAIADALSAEPADALYSSPALRCRESLEPLAERLGLPVATLPELGEENWRNPEGWEQGSHEMAFAAGKAFDGIGKLQALHTDGRIVTCSHGHIIPALVAYLIGVHGLPAVPQITQRGHWYRLRFSDERVDIERKEAAQGFPN